MNLFHVSEKHLGDAPKLWPRVPLRRGPDEDSKTARICVAPSVASCLRMVAWNDGVDEFCVYRLVTDLKKVGLRAPTLKAVPDLGRTARHQEAWLTKASTFEWVGTVRMDRVALVTGRPCFWWETKFMPFEEPHEDQMSELQVENHLAGVAAVAKIMAEMEDEIRAGGGKMAGDFFVQR